MAEFLNCIKNYNLIFLLIYPKKNKFKNIETIFLLKYHKKIKIFWRIEMPQKSLKKNAIYNFIKCFMNVIFPVISFPYASRILMPDGIGAINFANSIIEYFIMLAGLGISTYATREAAKIRDNKDELTKFTKEIILFNLITTIISYAMLTFCLFFISKFNSYRILIILCSSKILFSTIGINWFYTANEEYGYITLRHTIFQIISLILLFLFVKSKDDYLIYAGIGVFSNVGANIFNFIYVRKFINVFKKTKINLSKHVKPIFVFFGVSAAGKVNSLLDTIMLGFIAGNLGVGLYSAARKLEKMVQELITSIVSTFMPRTSYLLEKKKENEYQNLINKVFNITFFFSIPTAIGLFFLAEPLTMIFCGEKYLDSVITMKLLSVCIILLSFNSYLNNLILTPNGLEKFMLYAQIISLVANASLNWFFISQGLKHGIKWSVFGAGIATLMVDFIVPIVKIIPCWKYIKNKSNFINFLKVIAGTVLMSVSLKIINIIFYSNWSKIFISVVTGSILYAVIEIALKHPSAKLIILTIKNKISRTK